MKSVNRAMADDHGRAGQRAEPDDGGHVDRAEADWPYSLAAYIRQLSMTGRRAQS